jgi:hypothetical protein
MENEVSSDSDDDSSTMDFGKIEVRNTILLKKPESNLYVKDKVQLDSVLETEAETTDEDGFRSRSKQSLKQNAVEENTATLSQTLVSLQSVLKQRH